MNSKLKKLRIKTKYFVPLIFIVASLLILYVFPKQGTFKYAFNEGRPWQYGLLTAPFDFPIYKDAAQLKQEQDSILTYYEPYYILDSEIASNAMVEFDADMNTNPRFKNMTPDNLLYIRNKLKKLYENGIMRSDNYDKVSTSKTQSLRIKTDNVANSYDVKSFSTIRSAYEQIMQDRPESLPESTLKALDLNNYIRENVIYDASTSDKARNEFIQQVSPSVGLVQTGQRIIDQGEIISPQTYNILLSLKRITEERSGGTERNNWIILGQFLLILTMMGAFFFYLLFFRPKEYHNRQHVLFMVMLIAFFVVFTAITIRYNLFSVYIIPYAILTILIRTFIDSRTANFAGLITVILCSLMVPFPFEFIVIEMAVTVVSVFMLKELTERSQLIRSSFFILLVYVVVYIGFSLFQEGNLDKIEWVVLIYFLINFIFIMFSYTLVYLMEKTFGFISGVSMVELSNINKPLLKELSEKAPGTFQHSLQVSNLAMAAAIKLGANASLIRTGALYHDIGKMENPAFFTENQVAGMNPHTGLPFEESAKIIISHVKDGVKIAQKNGIPKQLIDFIETHHGTSMPRYFYNSWKNANPGKEVDESLFRYPGPNPFSRETAILMMADTVEAASRSLSEYTEESISKLVNSLIDAQVSEGYFSNTPITFKNIRTIKDVFIDKLKTIYHTRIAYPELKKEIQSRQNEH
ncbi:MAG: HDIG domain-containing protein [Dysgonamonadaceae bacterium]|nr:HDIG domain-containing protein [Dysgonamonadaceae bacterium]